MFVQVYDQIYNLTNPFAGGANAKNYTSPVLHSVEISGLKPNIT
jgi:hypothetical protein